MNKLTVCICAYNAELYIGQTLQGLFEQTFRDFDLLIINDCSTDHTVRVIEKFFADHHWKQTKIVTLPENSGLANARRYAENLVETEFLCFIDADDIPLPEAIEKMFHRISSDPDCMTVSCYCEYISPEAKKIGGGIFIGPTTKEKFMKQSAEEKRMFIPPFNISRVQYIRQAGCRSIAGFPPGKPRYQDMCEDLDLWTRMSDFYKDGKYIIVLPEILFQYRKMPSSMSANGHAMSMRMRHIKCNLKRRRAGFDELTFIDYMATLSRWQKIKYAYEDWGQNFYKQAGFHYLQKNYFHFLWNIGCAVLFAPGYFIQKLIKNVLPAVKK